MNTPIDFQTSIPRILYSWTKEFSLDKTQSIELSASFYLAFYKYRKEHNCLHSNTITISKKNLKLVLHESSQLAKNTRNISYQKLQSIFFREVSNIDHIQLSNLSVPFTQRGKKMFVTALTGKIKLINQNILGMNYEVLKSYNFFKGYSFVPFELVCILAFDVYLTFEDNKEHFFQFKNNMTYLMKKCISELFLRIGREIEGDNHYYLFNAPCLKNDFQIIRQSFLIPISYSLPLLCDYFGYSAWYKQFLEYDENLYDDYYKFNSIKELKNAC